VTFGDAERADITLEPLPNPGPPFRAGDEVAFFPAEISADDDPGWLRWDYAVIDQANQAAQTFTGHFVSSPEESFSQDLNNIVRRTANYYRWRAAIERGDADEVELRTHVLAEHPIHGGTRYPHALVAARRRRPRDIHQR
jgi:hypothetical protein